MKIFKMVGIPVLVLSLVLGGVSPTLAAPNKTLSQDVNRQSMILTGEVIEVNEGEGYFVIQSWLGQVTIVVNEDTRYARLSPPSGAVALVRRNQAEIMEQVRERVEQALSRHRQEIRQRVMEKLEQVLPGNQPESGEQGRQKLERLVPGIARLSPVWRIMEQARERVELRQESQENLRQWGLGWFRHFGEEATLADIVVGTQVLVQVVPGDDNPLARLVIIYEPTTYQCVTGTVVTISPADGTITIAPDDESDDIVINYNEGTSFILRGVTGLEEGQSVLAIYNDEMIACWVVASIEVSELAE